MKNLKVDAKKFRSRLQPRARKQHHPDSDAGERRNDAGGEFREADRFQVKRSRKAPRPNRTCRIASITAWQIDKIITSTPLDPAAANTLWSAVKAQYPRERL